MRCSREAARGRSANCRNRLEKQRSVTKPKRTPDVATVFGYVLGLADDALILGHRLSEWCGHAPLLEEELALANIGLDLIGQARALYDYAGVLEGKDRDQDALAYLRDAPAFRNLLLA